MREESADAVARLFDEHISDVYGLVACRIGDRAEAEDSLKALFTRRGTSTI
jgi:hypothetical protein